MALYTSDMAGSGQFGICARCNKGPTREGHDGCLGTLPGLIMNACCGHGNGSQSYIQYWGGKRISGDEALAEQDRLIQSSRKLLATRIRNESKETTGDTK